MALNVAVTNSSLPTLYEYYTAGGIRSGLQADQSFFTLNEKNISLYSGAMHYFRTPKQLWRDRLRKMRAAGLNTVETYIPWNLHEPSPGQFDFGHGGSDMEDFLDLETFLKTAQEEDLLAILRPGPYICAEWEFGGFPSWLLREKDIQFRTSDSRYLSAVNRFFDALLPILTALQFINGGPVVMVQVENEYGSTDSGSGTDKEYLKELRRMYLKHNISAVLATADGIPDHRDSGSLSEYFLLTANFDSDPIKNFDVLEEIQPGRPKMAMEYYPGWFDHWSEEHQTTSAIEMIVTLEELITYPGSFNIYMFLGGTSYGFLNGANLDNGETDNSGYQPDTTSYDYDAPLTEAGDYTLKYLLLKALLSNYASPETKIPELPVEIARIAYPDIALNEHLPLETLITSQPLKLEYETPTAMELLDINNGTGQSYGYLTYRKEQLNLKPNATLTIEGNICDSVLVLVNGVQIAPSLNSSDDLNNFGFYRLKDSSITLTQSALTNATLDLVVENWGRVNYGSLYQYYQYKGLWQGDLLVDDKVVKNWQHIPLEFKKQWTLNLSNWKKYENQNGPGLYKGIFYVEGTTRDTYVDMRDWTKGIVIVNGFVLGRYARIGPQQCLYLPTPLIKQGLNEIVIFEHYKAGNVIQFSANQIWKTR